MKEFICMVVIFIKIFLLESNTEDIKRSSLPFIAPERANRDPYDKKVDYYSIGVIFYMLLSFKHPYHHILKDNTLDS